MSESTERLSAVEQNISHQIERLRALSSNKANPGFIKIEYKRLVQLLTKKYSILLDALLDQKSLIDEIEYQTQKKTLEESYKDDIISAAIAIDETLSE